MERALILSGGGARGAFQVGVLKFLHEINWNPDMICGSSVGAINAVAIGSGMKPDQLEHLWLGYGRTRIYRLTLQKFLLSFLGGRKFHSPMDTAPLKSMLTKHLDIGALQRSKTEIIITATNMRTSELTYFNHRTIDIEHLMAASAMPMVFPWQFIDGEPYWDGALISNTPIMPALTRGAKSVIVVLLSPVGVRKQKLPRTHAQVGDLILEQFLMGSYHISCDLFPEKGSLGIVAPTHMLGLSSLLNFSTKQISRLIQEGYDNAKDQLESFLG